MTLTTEKIEPPQRKNTLARRWILIINLLVLLLLTARTITPAHSSYAPILGNSLVPPSLTPTATATATSTTKPTATKSTAPSSTPQTMVKVSSDYVNLHTGPGTNFAVVRKLTFGELLVLLGRLSDNTWLYVKTSDSQEGWIKPTSVDLAGINVDYYPIKTPSASPETRVKVSGDYDYLRTGPGPNFAVVRKLTLGELLMLLGRMTDNTWLYVKTSDSQEGWIKSTSVDLAGIDVDYYPIKTPSPSPETTVKVSGDYVNLRTGPRPDYVVVRKLAFGELLMLLGRLSDNTWLYVKTSDGQVGWIKTTSVDLAGIDLDYDYHPVKTPPPTETSTPVVLVGIEGHWIDIDLSDQRLYAYDGTDLVASFLVSTGIYLYPTETGQYRIYVKLRYSDMHGHDYYLPDVPYTMYYNNDFSIHGTYWHHNFGTPMSHGCVNMDTRDAEWLYNWASLGTLVNIQY